MDAGSLQPDLAEPEGSAFLGEEEAESDTAAGDSAQGKRKRRKKGQPVPNSQKGPHFKGLAKKVSTLMKLAENELGNVGYVYISCSYFKNTPDSAREMQVSIRGSDPLIKHFLDDDKKLKPELMAACYEAVNRNTKAAAIKQQIDELPRIKNVKQLRQEVQALVIYQLNMDHGHDPDDPGSKFVKYAYAKWKDSHPSWWPFGALGSKAVNNCNKEALQKLGLELLNIELERLVSVGHLS